MISSYYEDLANQTLGVQSTQTAPFGTQIFRGLTKGLTANIVSPMADAGAAGLPETVANIGGAIAGFVPIARGAGLGVAGLAKLAPKFAPKLLKQGVTAEEAAARMFQRGPKWWPGAGSQMPRTFAPTGLGLALGSAAGTQAAAETAFDTEEHTLPGALGRIGFAAGLGGVFGRIGYGAGKHAGDVAEEIKRVVGADPGKIGYTSEQFMTGLQERLKRAEEFARDPHVLASKKLRKVAFAELKEARAALADGARRAGVTPPASAAARLSPVTEELGQTLEQPGLFARTSAEASTSPTGPYPEFVKTGRLSNEPTPPVSTEEIMGRFSGEAGQMDLPLPPPIGQRPSMPLGAELLEGNQAAKPPAAPLGRDLAESLGLKPSVKPPTLEGETPPGAIQELGMVASALRKPLPQFVEGMTDNEVIQHLSKLGFSIRDVDPQRAKNMLLETLGKGRYGALQLPEVSETAVEQGLQRPYRDPRTGQMTKTYIPKNPHEASLRPVAGGIWEGNVKQEALRGEAGKIVRGPIRETLYGPGATPLPSRFEIVNPIDLSSKVEKALKRPEKILRPGTGKREALTSLPPGIEPEHLDRGVVMLRNARGHLIPTREQILLKLSKDVPFGTFGICEPGSWCSLDVMKHFLELDPQRVTASGFGKTTRKYAEIYEKHARNYIGRAGHILPFTWLLSGTPAEKLPSVMSQIEGHSESIVRQAINEALPVFQLSDESANKLSTIMSRLAAGGAKIDHDNIWRLTEEAVSREVPEASQVLGPLRELMESMRRELVVDGVLRPNQQLFPYGPIVRDRLEASVEGAVQIGPGGQSYIPGSIENIISGYTPSFAKRRGLQTEVPAEIGFKDALRVYFHQYARHKSLRENLGELNRLLGEVPEEMRGIVMEHVNGWMGHPNYRQPAAAWSRELRNLNFARTIGFSVLSPLTNMLQRVNTYAYARSSAFAQAFADAADPVRLQMMRDAGLGHVVDMTESLVGKTGVDEHTGGPVARMIEKYGMGSVFRKVERGNRVHAFMAGLREAEAQGVESLPERLAFARDLMEKTQFIQTRANAPLAFQSPFGQVIGQFQSFRLNQLHFMTRLLDDARQFVNDGDPKHFLPFLKFWTPVAVLTGAGGVMLGDFAEEQATRAMFGEAKTIPGLLETLFGVTLKQQLGIGALGAEDLDSFWYFLPGPSVSFLQSLLGGITGRSVGRGVDIGSFGRELSPEETYRARIQVLPGGIQANRIIQAMKLIQNSGEYRQALDFSEFLGLAPASGDLLSEHAASVGQIMSSAAGIQPAFRGREREELRAQEKLTFAYQTASKKAGTFYAAGRTQDAMQVMQDFSDKHLSGQAVPLSRQSIRAAQKRRLTPPGQRLKPPKALIGAEEFEDKESIWGDSGNSIAQY